MLNNPNRDLKPTTILLKFDPERVHGPLFALSDQEFVAAAESDAIQIKITDFYLARFLPEGVLASTLCGTPVYMAPEVLIGRQRYDSKCDLFSLGVIIYDCLTGCIPFQQSTRQALEEFYQDNAVLRPDIPKQTSPELADLISRLLQRDAKDRIDFSDLFSHPFLCGRRSQKSEPSVEVLQTNQNVSAATFDNQSKSGQEWHVLGGREYRLEVGDYLYNPEHFLGRGSYGTVYQGHHRLHATEKVAIKVITKQYLSDEVETEIKILQELKSATASGKCHENLISLIDVYETPRYSYLVLECCNGGDLENFLIIRDTAGTLGLLSEKLIQVITMQLVSAIKALKEKGIIHR